MKTAAAVNIVNIIIADDHEILREGIISLIKKHPNLAVVAEASDGAQLVRLVDQYIPDVVIADIRMPVMDGIEATALITKKYPGIGVIALSMFDDDKFIIDMLEAGAKGYLLKDSPRAEIIEAINTMSQHGSYFCKNISLRMTKLIAESKYSKNRQKDKIEFTANELQVIDMICRQFFTREISEALHLSPRTIDGYRESILKKINARNSIGIVLYAIANKLFEFPNEGKI